MNNIYIDCEFTKFNGDLLSIALVRDRKDHLYLVRPDNEINDLLAAGDIDPWVIENVLPILFDCPESAAHLSDFLPLREWGRAISAFIYAKDAIPTIIADWPEDLIHFNRLLLTGPGTAVPMGDHTNMTCLRHIDVYPTTLEGAVQHNAWWDALAIREKVING